MMTMRGTTVRLPRCSAWLTRPRWTLTTSQQRPKHTKLASDASAQEVQEYLKEANKTMEQYHYTRELARLGKLPNKNAHYHEGASGGNLSNTAVVQVGVVAFFLIAFSLTPFLGRKIAQDPEFKAKYVPGWYDYTIKKPDNPWTRQELHEQMLMVEAQLRERAIKGDFEKEKLQQLDSNFRKVADQKQESMVGGWDRIHPGLEEGESVNEDE